jgi:uncharacterized protein YjlB
MQVIRWQETTPPQEEALRRSLQKEGLLPYTWSNGPHESYTVHSHSYRKVLYCLRGSISFTMPDYRAEDGSALTIHLAPGDCLLLPRGVRHSALVGPDGVTCLEAAQ